MMDWTSIALALISLVSGCGWVVNHRKYKQEVKNLAADSRLKDMELAQLYVQQFEETIGKPLRKQVGDLQNEIAQLRDAIQRIDYCAHRDDCPVLEHCSTSNATRHSPSVLGSALAAYDVDGLRKRQKGHGGTQSDDRDEA